MGNAITTLLSSLGIYSTQEFRILMIGLDNAGKTTLLYQMKVGEPVPTLPTVGFNVESVTYKNVTFNVWDVGGQDKIRALWKHYYHQASAVIYVIDAADKARIEEAGVELYQILEEPPLQSVPVLIFANKQGILFYLTFRYKRCSSSS